MTEKITYDGVLDDLCKHIIANLNVVSINVSDDYEEQSYPHGYNPNGGAAYYTIAKVLIQANATINVRVKVPAIPEGYELVQLSPCDLHVLGSSSCHLNTDFYLNGPDIDRDYPESLQSALDEVGDELAKVLFPAIDDELDAEYHDDFLDIQKEMKADTTDFAVQFDHDGAWLTFQVWV